MKTNKIYRYAAGALALIIAFTVGIPESFAANKNETVYARLKNDGSVEQVYVVNQLLGSYTDYGAYQNIKNLSTNTNPVIEGDKIFFPDAYVEGGLYYQGAIDAQLPIKTAILWFMDGQPVNADALAGSSGKLKLSITAAPNPLCDARIREGLTTQISVPMNMKKASNIRADGATVVSAGSTATISYVILPNEAGTLNIEADVRDFEMDSISITLIKTQMSLGELAQDIDELENGMGDMADGAQQMADGMTELKSGVKSIFGGVGDLSSGLDELSAQGQKLAENVELYGQGLGGYFSGVQGLATASGEINSGLEKMKEEGASVAGGVSNLHSGLKSTYDNNAELKALAQMLASSEDEDVRELAAGTLKLLGSVDTLSSHAGDAADGVKEYIAGVDALADKYGLFHQGLEALGSSEAAQGFGALNGGLKSYVNGVSLSADGLRSIRSHLYKLPPGLQEIIDAQLELKDGLNEAGDGIAEARDGFSSDAKAVSFVSPDKNTADSVQYILTTFAILKPKAKNELPTENTDKTFFERFADLFR